MGSKLKSKPVISTLKVNCYMNRKLNRTAKLSFFTARKRQGDATRIAENTGYSLSHVVNVMNGNRTVPQVMANEMYNISRRRIKNSEKEMA